jgi:hypothetical protein
MGASGNLSVINLQKHSFEDIKQLFLENLLYFCPPYHIPNNEYDELYFKVSEIQDIADFLKIFRGKVVSYCPYESGIFIDGQFYNDWADEEVPTIIGEYLVLYDTDQQMTYLNLPTELLWALIEDNTEIWT